MNQFRRRLFPLCAFRSRSSCGEFLALADFADFADFEGSRISQISQILVLADFVDFAEEVF